MFNDAQEPETFHPLHSVMSLFRRIPLLIGIGFVIWMALAKNFPALMPGHNLTRPTAASHPAQEPHPAHLNKNAPVEEAAAPAPLPLEEEHPAAPEPAAEAEHAAPPVAIPPAPSGNAGNEQIVLLKSQVEALNTELAQLKTQMGEHSEAIKKDDQALGEKLGQQDKTMQAMKAQIDSLQKNDAEELTAITAFSIMKETVMRGEPFETELKQMASVIHDSDKIALLSQLKPFAADGIMTLPALQAQFEKLLPDALSPGHKADSLTHNLQSLIRIRKEGEPQGADDEAILARAEAKINRGQIAGALKEIQALTPPAADVLGDWVRNAKTMIDGRNALDAFQLALLKNTPEHAAQKPAPVAPQPKPAAKVIAAPPAAAPPELVDDFASQPEERMNEIPAHVDAAPALPAAPVTTPESTDDE